MLVARAHEEERKRRNLDSDNFTDINEEVWTAFVRRLDASGYFRELLEGSKEREELLKKAQFYYKQHLANTSRRIESNEGEDLLQVYKNIQSNDVEMGGKKNFVV